LSSSQRITGESQTEIWIPLARGSLGTRDFRGADISGVVHIQHPAMPTLFLACLRSHC
jgi:hypothetical protein